MTLSYELTKFHHTWFPSSSLWCYIESTRSNQDN